MHCSPAGHWVAVSHTSGSGVGGGVGPGLGEGVGGVGGGLGPVLMGYDACMAMPHCPGAFLLLPLARRMYPLSPHMSLLH